MTYLTAVDLDCVVAHVYGNGSGGDDVGVGCCWFERRDWLVWIGGHKVSLVGLLVDGLALRPNLKRQRTAGADVGMM